MAKWGGPRFMFVRVGTGGGLAFQENAAAS